MADTRRALQAIPATTSDLEMVETLLVSRSSAQAFVAFSELRATFPERALVMLANVREVISEMPQTPFLAGTGMDLLEHACGYEWTGRSYRRLFESDHGLFGIEFLGAGTQCDGIVVHTLTGRLALHGDENNVIDHEMLQVLVRHEAVLDSVLEGLQTLGWPLEPRIYLTADDFIDEHRAAAAADAFGELF